MGKRYYCDYCDRSFKDDSEARKKHISSLQHAKNRADHYGMFKDPDTILREESAKVPCKRFMTHGDCAFGNGCRFSHYSPQMMWELRQMAAYKKRAERTTIFDYGEPNPDAIVKEFFENLPDSDGNEECDAQIWNIPIELQSYPNLPPSLWPITPESVTNSTFGKWGS